MQAYQVIVPGQDGDLGVRKGHSSFVVSMRPGVVEIRKDENAEPEHIFVAGGFADISAENCTVLAEEATPVSELIQADIESTLSGLEQKISDASSDTQKQNLQNKILIAQEKLKACA